MRLSYSIAFSHGFEKTPVNTESSGALAARVLVRVSKSSLAGGGKKENNTAEVWNAACLLPAVLLLIYAALMAPSRLNPFDVARWSEFRRL